jgi:hypothetical protein
MKPTKKELEEINFLSQKYHNFTPTEQEITCFIENSRYGTKQLSKLDKNANRLFIAKMRLNFTMKMWIEDLRDQLLFPEELIEDFDCPYFRKIMRGFI